MSMESSPEKLIDTFTLEELRFIVRQFARMAANDGCPLMQYNDFHCEYCDDCSNVKDDYDGTNEVDYMCWLKFYVWCYRNKRNPQTGRELGA